LFRYTTLFRSCCTVHGGVDQVHGKMFPRDFSAEDWHGFDHFIAECIQEAYKSNLKIEKTDLSDIGWTKQFQNNYGEATYQFISDNIENWNNIGFVSNKIFNEQYQEFSNDLDIPAKYRLSAQRMNSAISEFCKKHEIKFDANCRKKINSIQTRGK